MKPIVLASIFLIAPMLLSGCDNKSDANEKNFTSAMNKHLEQEGQLCLNINEWPVDITSVDEKHNRQIVNQMKALESIHLVKSDEAEVDYKPIFAPSEKMNVKRYSLTQEASPFIKERDITRIRLGGTQISKTTSLCWGEESVEEIIKWEGPATSGTETNALITYTYKVTKQAPWADNPAVRAAFPSIGNTLEGEKKKELKRMMSLSNK